MNKSSYWSKGWEWYLLHELFHFPLFEKKKTLKQKREYNEHKHRRRNPLGVRNVKEPF